MISIRSNVQSNSFSNVSGLEIHERPIKWSLLDFEKLSTSDDASCRGARMFIQVLDDDSDKGLTHLSRRKDGLAKLKKIGINILEAGQTQLDLLSSTYLPAHKPSTIKSESHLLLFASRLLAWILSRVMGASVGFRVGGWKCLRDVVLKFNKGAIESISVGEIRLSLRQSLVKLGVGFISRDPKLQVLICDLEVVIRSSKKGTQKTRSKNPAAQTPKATLDIKELRVDISKDGGSEAGLFVKLQLFPINVHLGESRLTSDQSVTSGGSFCAYQLMDGVCPPFSCEEFALLCEFGHNSCEVAEQSFQCYIPKSVEVAGLEVSNEDQVVLMEAGVVIKDLDITCGEVRVNLNEDFLLKEKGLSDTSPHPASGVVPADKESGSAKKPQGKQALSAVLKYTSIFPEKAAFTLPKLDVKLAHRDYGLIVENNIMGIQLKCMKSRSVEDVGECVRLDVQMEFSEIHLLRETGISIVEILKLDVVSSVYIPLQPNSPIRSEIDVKLGGTQCNLMLNRLEPWTRVQLPRKQKKELLEESHAKVKSQSSEQKAIMWTCTLSAPELTVVLYSLSGCPLYHGCSQSSHIFANNISSTGASLHMELGELNLHMSDEYQECLKESLFGVETNTGSIMHIAKVSMDLGKKDTDSPEDGSKCKMILGADVTGMGVYLTFRRIESLISTALSLKALVKKLSASSKKPAQSKGMRSSRPSGKGIQLLRLNLERCSINVCGDVGLENTVVPDPKRVNYGSQGGRVLISNSADGTPRTAHIISTISNGGKKLKYSVSLDIFHFSFCMNKEKKSTQMELERARSIYQEFPEDNNPGAKVALLDMQNAKLVRRSGGLKEIEETSLESVKLEKPVKKRESIFAVDVEMLSISAEVGDGVETFIQVQSIFSENARIGVLLEGLMLQLNEARVFRSSRMQISRVPNVSGSLSDVKSETVTTWDWVIQALDVHICMPFRLELRAIDDSVEEMLRVLKLVTSAKTRCLSPPKNEQSKPKKASSTRTGSLKFSIRKLTADIEEEPMQGWLDEHYQLLKNRGSKIHYNGEEIDLEDAPAIQKLREEVYKQSFRSYYKACQGLVPSQGSGACKNGFQAGFKPSTARTSLFSICATELDLTLTKIEGGDAGMIEVLQKLDPVCRAHNIPFSRLYGGNIILRIGSLVAQIRNYTCPLLAATGGRCEGRLILAQQATCFQPQIHQDVYIGRWRKVDILRSATGTTPPVKTYCDLPIHFQKGEVSFGIGFEPSFADLSYAFTVALRRANLSIRNPNPVVQPLRKKKLTLQSDGRVYASAKDFKIYLSSLESLLKNSTLKHSSGFSAPFLEAPVFTVEVTMEWDCESGNPLNHYLFALPNEGVPRQKVFDPFRSTALSLRWNFSLRPSLSSNNYQSQSTSVNDQVVLDGVSCSPLKSENELNDSPIVNLGHHDLAWLIKFWNLNYLPPHKLRTFSRWPRFGLPRIPRSGNLSLDKVMTEFMFRVDATPTCIRHMPLHDDDPAKGLTFKMTKLKYEMYYGRGKQKYTFECVRDPLDLVYQGLDLHVPKAYINKEDCATVAKVIQMTRKKSQSASMERVLSDKNSSSRNNTERHPDDGFLLSSDYFTIRRQSPKADPARLLAWQEAGRRNLEMTYVRSEFENGSESDDHTRSDPSDDDGYNVVIADNCQRIFVYGLKLLWTLENRDAVWSWVGGLSKAFEPPKPSPSRQYAQRKLLEENDILDKPDVPKNDNQKSTSVIDGASSSSQNMEASRSLSSPSNSNTLENPFSSAIDRYSEKVVAWTKWRRADISWVAWWGQEVVAGMGNKKNEKSGEGEEMKLHGGEVEEQQQMGWALVVLEREAVGDGRGGLLVSRIERKTKMRSGMGLIFGLKPSFNTYNAWKLLAPQYFATKYSNIDDSEEEGTRHFMVNVIEPQFNLHSEESNSRPALVSATPFTLPELWGCLNGLDFGRFLLAAVSGRVLARSFHSVLHVGYEMIEQALGGEKVQIPESQPEMTWNRMEFSVMLEHVQAHVAPTDVDPGAGLQWLPKIRRSSPKVKRTGALLERVFMPCDMYFRYTRHKGGTSDLKVKPLKELTFNSHNITAAMTSRQFQVMLDVLTNLLFARLPNYKTLLSWAANDGDGQEFLLAVCAFREYSLLYMYSYQINETTFSYNHLKKYAFVPNGFFMKCQRMLLLCYRFSSKSGRLRFDDPGHGKVVCHIQPKMMKTLKRRQMKWFPDGVEEVELAKVNLEQKERVQKLILDDIRKLSLRDGISGDPHPETETDLWMVTSGRPTLVQKLKKELISAQKSRKAASASLRLALQKAAQLRLMEKEKNKSPSYAMRISLQINKVVWGMLVDGKSFAEAEINDMIYDFDRDYKDVGVAKFTTKYFVVRNCLPNAKSDMLLSAWNPPAEWGKKVMLHVDAKQGFSKDGNSPLELFQVEIYPLKIHLTESLYKLMWQYFFPEEEQDSQRRQQVWKGSTTAGARRVKKGTTVPDASPSSSHSTKDAETSKSSTSNLAASTATNQSSIPADSSQASKLQNLKANVVCGSNPELRRTSSFDRTWEENVAESVANELVLQLHSSSKSAAATSLEQQDEATKSKLKDLKLVKPGRSSHEEKKAGKVPDEKRSQPRKLREFHNIKISQVELLVTYEGSRFAVSDLRLLMDTFHRVEFTGTWRRLFSRVKKHIIWGVLKSVTGMQGKKFKDKAHIPVLLLFQRVNSISVTVMEVQLKKLISSQLRGQSVLGEAENELHGDWSESDAEFSPFARQLTITKAKRLIRRHTKKFRSRGQKGLSLQQKESLPASPMEGTPFEESDSSSGSSPYEDFHE
ncbi:hypothetical protein DH2020_008361 [Rehmannia glutinosa]|uniref:FMP27/BLTP2/Hobbit GFWDK motif-containing RBG unit domain-containing protein n=1 Tax=Rehmannia glutinosa TaxID=99300 RepID=A0ABR0U0T7_REHGL